MKIPCSYRKTQRSCYLEQCPPPSPLASREGLERARNGHPIAALASAGIPDNSVVQYETAIQAGKFVVGAHGSADEVERARAVLAQGSSHVETYEPPASPVR